MGLIPGLGTSTCHGWGQKKKKMKNDFDRLINRLDTDKERIRDLEDE